MPDASLPASQQAAVTLSNGQLLDPVTVTREWRWGLELRLPEPAPVQPGEPVLVHRQGEEDLCEVGDIRYDGQDHVTLSVELVTIPIFRGTCRGEP